MVSRTLGTAIACAVVALLQCPMAIYVTDPRQKRRLGKQIVATFAVATVLYRADGGHWVKTDALLFIGLGVLALTLLARFHLVDSLGNAVAAAIVLWSWGALNPSTTIHDNAITALLCLCIIAGTGMCLRAYGNYLPETTMMLLNEEVR